MKLLELRLIAFGPFTDTILDLSAGNAGLHMVHGYNEAGKSSALRALRQMFFGIPVRSPDNHLHPYPRMRVGARLACHGGNEIELVRRKGQSKTLRAGDDDTVLDEAVLSNCLGEVGEDFFNRMFAIGHDDLVRGGLEIVSGGGDVGQALFAAGSGLIRLRDIQQQLTEEMEALFKPAGSNPRINRALTDLRDTRNALKEAILPGKVWQTHDQALREARQRIDRVREELVRNKQTHARLERIRAALPLMARRVELQAALAGYADLPVLPADFTDQRHALETALALAESDRRQAQAILAKASEQIDALVVPEVLPAHAEAVETLQQELGSFNKARKDRPQLETRMAILEQEAASRLAEAGGSPGGLPLQASTLTHAAVGAIQALAKSHARLIAKRETVVDNRHRLVARIKTLGRRRHALGTPVDLFALKTALEEALGAGSLEEQLSREQLWLRQARQTIEETIRRQTLWPGAADLQELPAIPSQVTIDAFEGRLGGVAQRIERLQTEQAAAQKELARVTAELKGLEQTWAVPSEADLTAARGLRDQGWALVRRILTGESVENEEMDAFIARFAAAETLSDAFAQSMSHADAVADRLRREAERVNRKGVLLVRKEQYAADLADLETALAQASAEQAALTEQWRQQWASAVITPRSPREMRAWSATMEAVQAKVTEVRERAARADTMGMALTAMRDNLARAMSALGQEAPPDAGLGQLLSMAKALIAAKEQAGTEIAGIERERAALEAELEAAEARAEALENELAQWKGQWGRSVAAIGLSEEDDPSVAHTVIDALRQARAKTEEAQTLRKRIAGIDRDAEAFCRQVAALVAVLAPDLKEVPADVGAAGLNARLGAAREAASRRRALEEQAAQAEKMRATAQKIIAENRVRLDTLCRQAGCTDPQALPAVEARVQAHARLTAELKSIDQQLRRHSAGATVEAFIADAAAEDPDTIGNRLDRLAAEIKELEQERSRLDQTIGIETGELARMDGGARAARYAEEVEHLLARLEADARHYSRLKIAAAVLAGAIEQYREKNQGPLIRRAGELFARMTLGAFDLIRAEYDDKGHPVLVGVRPGGEHVRVEGMSDGTADQLYLCLRLAGLEQYLQNNTPLPFVVDDILLRFDDRRAAATLDVLADLSRRTQVIFFTHHYHLVQLAQSAETVAAVLHVHRLVR